jgi:hypothetical protein
VLIGLAIGCGVLVLLCCGGLGIAAYFFGRSFDLSEDPARVREVTEEIISIDVPEAIEPKVSLDWTMPFVNRRMVSMAVYADRDEHSALVLFQLNEGLGQVNPETMRSQFEQSMRDSGGGEWNEVKLDESETAKREINGAEAEFTVGRGKVEKTDREVWQAMGSFAGKGGAAMLFLQLDAADFSKEQVIAVLDSMK